MAYLIIAHKDDETFRNLCSMLDDERNDLYIHMDAKNQGYDSSMIQKIVKKSIVHHCPRISVSWGGFSMIRAELLLLKCATQNGNYCHYHLLSGEDLPIKSNDEIYNFFVNHKNEEFVTFDSPTFQCSDRVSYYYRFQEKSGRGNNIYASLQGYDICLQKKLHIVRNKDIQFQKGAQWFSITDDFARYVVEHEKWIKRVFRNTACCDEVFLQSLMIQSPFIDHLYSHEFNDDYHASMRLIDWKRGTPYVFQKEDFEEIKNSDRMFARKFQAEKDAEIIEIIRRSL